MAAPKAGDVVEGWEFLGGDPKDPKAWADWGDGAQGLPDGSIVRYGARGGMTYLRQGNRMTAGTSPDIKEFQANAAARATLMDQGQTDYEQARAEGYDPGAMRNQFARFIEDAPIPGGNFLSDVIRDKPSERGRAAELQFTDGALRTTTGANAPEPEVIRANKSYFRQPGESAGVEGNKKQLRTRFRDQAVRIAGPAYIPPNSLTMEPRNVGGAKPPEGFAGRMTAPQRQGAAQFRGSQRPSGDQGNPWLPTSEEEFEKLPVGSYFLNPADGRVLRKAR